MTTHYLHVVPVVEPDESHRVHVLAEEDRKDQAHGGRLLAQLWPDQLEQVCQEGIQNLGWEMRVNKSSKHPHEREQC